ncbi:type II toxin-antitoxin system ParD family antitoxin [Methylobacterium currus]|uniref:ribbon-helix-helix domain-containing protein n=1 Tax=Methylobacterium currus TaxID=2051553 RepID=UPI001E58CCCE|nr:type II toxin-antitoxin system ParD family antitoxin [Methylobacterium currus]UHC15167.1 type II toxin-antitoxin system ParD family antitoxin [Methylobacterium currus]
MAHIERLTVVFPEPMAAQIHAAVEAGDYASTSEAVRDAVRLWSDRRQMRAHDLERLQQARDEGKASGSAGEVNFKALRQDARNRLAALSNDRDGQNFMVEIGS